MNVTGAFLAENAAIVDDKLHVWGGVLSRYALDTDRVAHFVLVVLTQAETGNTDRNVDIEISPPTGDDRLTMRFEVPEATAESEIGFAYFGVQIELPFDGRWVFVVSAGSGAVALPLTVNEQPHQTPHP